MIFFFFFNLLYFEKCDFYYDWKNNVSIGKASMKTVVRMSEGGHLFCKMHEKVISHKLDPAG